MSEQAPFTPEETAARAKLQAVLTHDEFLEFEVYQSLIEDTHRAEVAAMKVLYPDFHTTLFSSIATAFSEGEGKTKLDGWRLQGVSNRMVTELLGNLLLDKIHQYMNERERKN